MHLLDKVHPESCKGIMHMAVFFVVLLQIKAIDRKIHLLEKRFMNK
jgi:hypothetical protein